MSRAVVYYFSYISKAVEKWLKVASIFFLDYAFKVSLKIFLG